MEILSRLPIVGDALEAVVATAEAAVEGAAGFIFDGQPEAGATRRDAMEEAAQRAADEARDLFFRLEREVIALNALMETYTKALSTHLNKKTQAARLQVHIKNNILYYMQAIWNHDPPDQRLFLFYETPIPIFKARKRQFSFDADAPLADTLIPPHRSLPRFGGRITKIYCFRSKTQLESELKFTTLFQAAALDMVLSYKGNYITFALNESNLLTDYMMDPYVDRGLGELVDPANQDNWTMTDFTQYACCLKELLTAQEFEQIRPQLKQQHERLLTAPRGSNEVLIVPTDLLFIEALPAGHTLIKDFKARHQAVDIKKVQTEVRKMELENIRRAARILADAREDTDIEAEYVLEGDGSVTIVLLRPLKGA